VRKWEIDWFGIESPDLGDDEAARQAGFRNAAECDAYWTAYHDPRVPPPPFPPEGRARVPGWDIHLPGGGLLYPLEGDELYGDLVEADEPMTPADVRAICRRSGVTGADEGVVVADAREAWRRGNVAIKTLYIVAKAGPWDVAVEGGKVRFVVARSRAA
jgi:hypothetical protein